MVQPLDANSLLIRVYLPSGEGHVTLNASNVKDLTFVKKKILGKLERGGRLGGVGGSSSKLTEAKVREGMFRIGGTRIDLEDTSPMASTLDKMAPYVTVASEATRSKMVQLELVCAGLTPPDLSHLATNIPLPSSRALSPDPLGSSSATANGSSLNSNSSTPAPLSHASHSRPKAARRGGGARGAPKTGGINKFTMNPTNSSTPSAEG